jgi:DNA-binding transcriptional LysR family regulator
LRPAAEEVEAAVATFERQLAASDKDLTGTIRVTCGSILADRLRRTDLIDEFHARHPGLQVELVISDRFLDLSKGEADVAIRAGEPRDEALVGRTIAEASWAVYASHGYLGRHGRPIRPKDIDRHIVVGCGDSIAHYAGARWLQSVAPHATIATRSDNWPGLVLAVKSGAGLAALLAFQGDNEPDLVRAGRVADSSRVEGGGSGDRTRNRPLKDESLAEVGAAKDDGQRQQKNQSRPRSKERGRCEEQDHFR